MNNTGPFVVVAYRWGLRDAHSYVIGCYIMAITSIET